MNPSSQQSQGSSPEAPGTTTPKKRPTRSFRRRWAGRLLALLISVAVTLGLTELCVSTSNLFGVHYAANTMRYRQEVTNLVLHHADGTLDLDGCLYRNRPGAEASINGVTLKINALGFRGPEVEREKPDGVFRILALGDSVAFGWGVNDESTYLRRLEADLREQYPDRRIEVINTGHPGYDSVQEATLLEREGLALSPDLVLLTYVINDVDPTRDLAESYLEAAAKKTPQDKASSWSLGSLLPSLATLYRQGASRMSSQPKGDSGTLHHWLETTKEKGWRRSRDALVKIRDLCRARDVPLLVLDHTDPRIPELPEFCRVQGIACQNLQFTDEENGPHLHNSLCDPHCNPKGHELLLAKLKRALAAEGHIPLR